MFQRSAFLSGADLTVTQDQDLARRLGALAAAGRESDSYPQTESRLKLWQNRCRYHRTGRIPETEEQLDKVRALLEEAEALRRRAVACESEQERLTAQADEAARLHRETERQTRRQLDRDEDRTRQALEAADARTASLPSGQALLRLQTLLENHTPAELPPEVPCPPALAELDAGEIWPKAQADAAAYEALTTGKLLAMPQADWLLAAVFGLLTLGIGIAMAVLEGLNLWGAAWLTLLAAAGFTWHGFRAKKKNRAVLADRTAAKAILAAYDAKNKEDMLTAAMTRRDWLLARDQWEKQSWEEDLLLEQVREFAPEAGDRTAALTAVAQGLELLRQAEAARRDWETARLRREQYHPAADTESQTLHRRCAALTAEREALQRQLQALGSWEALDRQRQQLEEALEDLQLREQALILARQALASANGQLAQVYAPQVTRLAGAYLEALTQGRYDGMLLEPDLTLSVREKATGLVRSLAVLSRGAQDQAWLALRLSMTQLLLPPDTPIVLDDALLTFDRDREQAALAVLQNENRQVLLFSCR